MRLLEIKGISKSASQFLLGVDNFLIKMGRASETSVQIASRKYLEEASLQPPAIPEPIIKWQSLKKYAALMII